MSLKSLNSSLPHHLCEAGKLVRGKAGEGRGGAKLPSLPWDPFLMKKLLKVRFMYPVNSMRDPLVWLKNGWKVKLCGFKKKKKKNKQTNKLKMQTPNVDAQTKHWKNRLRVRLDRTYFAETENWKRCSKIIFKCVNSTVRPIFNKKSGWKVKFLGADPHDW